MPRLRTPIVVAALAALAGCLPTATLEHRPEAAQLCRTVDARGWTGTGATWQLTLDDGDHAYFSWSDAGSTRDVAGPIEGVYWVGFSAFTVSRLQDGPRPVMVFDPSTAVLEIGGRRVHALPRLWASELAAGYYAPKTELPVPGRLSGGSFMGHDFFLAFPVPSPRARDTWRVDAGTITIEGRDTPLPVAQSCFTPSKTWWAPIY